jgi:hypothetical protein
MDGVRAIVAAACVAALAACAPAERGLGGAVALRDAVPAVAVVPNSTVHVSVRGETPEAEARAEAVRKALVAWLVSRGRFARSAAGPEEADYVLDVVLSGPRPGPSGLTRVMLGGRDVLSGELALTERGTGRGTGRGAEPRVIRRWTATGEAGGTPGGPSDATGPFVVRAASLI